MRYPIYLRWSEEDQAWIAEIPDLPGCIADGKTETEAIKAVGRTASLWLQVAKEEKRKIPRQSDLGEPSGRFLVRLPKSLHRRLQLLAKRENVSLNQLVSNLLAIRETQERA